MGSTTAFTALSKLRLVDRRFHTFINSHFAIPHLAGLGRSSTIPFQVYAPMKLQRTWLKLHPGETIPHVGWSMFRELDDAALPPITGRKRSSNEMDRDDNEFVVLVVDA